MDFKRLGFVVVALQIAGCASTDNIESSEKHHFQNYALAICLGSAFENDQVKADFNKSANGHMERGHMPIEAYQELRETVQLWLQKDYPSKHGGQVNSTKCFDFYRSPELVNLFGKYDPCRLKSA